MYRVLTQMPWAVNKESSNIALVLVCVPGFVTMESVQVAGFPFRSKIRAHYFPIPLADAFLIPPAQGEEDDGEG